MPGLHVGALMVDGGTSLGSVSAPEAAAVFYLRICSVQNAEAAQETDGDASPAIPPGRVCKSHLLSRCVFLPEAAGIVYSFLCTVSWFQQERGTVPF